ncbi:gene transfer agent family protein [Microvirga lenta]|uniref:gene transfer agent family protein n=1 Tax=Microvirga lenta TaxID=2881337 RepID=UPI001CFC6F51|nr:gene transfer agent family protein [Microvirga lenta]MCB5173643.1 gene transfer agent family protein [Microvirga lenta]
MSRTGSVELDFADGTYTFRLGIGQLRELQETVNKPRVRLGAPLIGPMSLLQLLQNYDAWPHEVREVIRLGLIGGGTKPEDALDLVRRYVEIRPLMETAIHAQAILSAALAGTPEEPIEGKPEAASQEVIS